MNKPHLPSREALLDNGPVIVMTAIAFGGSFYTIAEFIGRYGTPGLLQFLDAGLPDLLCFSAAREIMRDKRTKRDRKGWMSFPIVAFAIGLAETIVLNYVGDSKHPLGQSQADFWNHALSLLAGTTLILGMLLIHRRESGSKISEQSDTRPATAGGWLIPAPVSAGQVSASVILSHPVSPWPVSADRVSDDRVSPDPVSPDRVSEPPVSPGPVSDPGVSPDPEPGWLEVLPGGGESGPEPDSAPGEEPAAPGEGRKGWTLPELTDYVREVWPTSQRDLRIKLATHPRGRGAQKTVCDAIRTVRAEKEHGQGRRAVND